VIPSQVNLLDMDKSYLLKRKITDQEYCVRKCVRLFYKNLPDACCKKKKLKTSQLARREKNKTFFERIRKMLKIGALC
jgi:hypothetical protein